MLIIQVTTPFSLNRLNPLPEKSALLLVDEASYAGVDHHLIATYLTAKQPVYALKTDLLARGILECVDKRITILTDDEYADLLLQANSLVNS